MQRATVGEAAAAESAAKSHAEELELAKLKEKLRECEAKVRQVKKDREVLKVVKAAVEEYKAAKAAVFAKENEPTLIYIEPPKKQSDTSAILSGLGMDALTLSQQPEKAAAMVVSPSSPKAVANTPKSENSEQAAVTDTNTQEADLEQPRRGYGNS